MDEADQISLLDNHRKDTTFIRRPKALFAEAVVQRVPEYVDPVDRPSVKAYDITLPTAVPSTAAAANKAFGRRMNVVSFRWLSSNEI